jgi:hypothetical protein
MFLPWRGEFGQQMVMTHVRWVHGDPSTRKIVCCNKGDEPLFPSASEFFYDWEAVPDRKRGTKLIMSPGNRRYLEKVGGRLLRTYPGAQLRYPLDGVKPQAFPWCPEHNFVPMPRCPVPAERPEILVAPRFRERGGFRNYEHWPAVITRLEDAGLAVGLLGLPGTSLDYPTLPKGYRAWDHADNMGVTLHWLKTARLVLCTDSGVAHLAVLAGAPLRVIYGKEGAIVKDSWQWTFDHMKAHAVASCEAVLNAWDDPEIAVRNVLARVPKPELKSR